MSNAVIERSNNEAVTSLAEAIIPSQQSEIEIMRQMRRERGFEPLNGGSNEDHGDHDHNG
jgi:hypothetical protein